MITVFGIWLGMIGILSAGELTFPQTTKEVEPDLGQKIVTTVFEFTNETDQTIVIRKFDGGCSCLSVELEDDKRTYKPGQSGVIKATVDVGNLAGNVDRSISLWTETKANDSPSQSLQLKIKIPELIKIEPKTVKWQVGDATNSQTVQIQIQGDKPIHVISVSYSADDKFASKLTTIKDGELYELLITPKATTDPTLTIFKLQTDCEDTRHASLQVFAVITRPNN